MTREVLTTQDDMNKGGNELVQHVLETSEQYQEQKKDINGYPEVDADEKPIMVPKSGEIDALIQNEVFMREMRPLAVKLVMAKRMQTEGIEQSEMLDILRTTWGQEFVQHSAANPQIQTILKNYGITAQPGTQEFQEQLEGAVLNREEKPDPTDPEKDPNKKNKTNIFKR